jgi:putative ABC transport system substrate-binding protein
VLRDPSSAAGIGQFASVRSVAQSLGVDLTPLDVRDKTEIERGIAAFARAGDGGVIVTAGGSGAHRKLIIDLVARYKLPTVYPYRYYAEDGGLIVYGPNTHEPVRRAAGYVDRILKGEKPGDVPVQAPTKYDLIVNLKTAKALGVQSNSHLLIEVLKAGFPNSPVRVGQRHDRFWQRKVDLALGASRSGNDPNAGIEPLAQARML